MNGIENRAYDEGQFDEADASASAVDTDSNSAAQAEIERLKNDNLKLLAETRNIQQRTRRESEERLKYAEADFARDLLLLLDDLRRTIDAAAPTSDNAALLKGLTLVQDGFQKFLKSRQIEQIRAEGQPFDPAQHEALLNQPSDEVPAGTVLQEITTGYRLHDRVIRPARVVVSSGPA